jgi:hypothetical protein
MSVYSLPYDSNSVGLAFFTRCEYCVSECVPECAEDIWNHPEVEIQINSSCSLMGLLPQEYKYEERVAQEIGKEGDCPDCKLETIQA